MTEPEPDTDDIPTPSDNGHGPSILGRIKARRDQLAEANVLDIPVPRWSDPEIWVRFRPLSHDTIEAGQRRIRKAKNPGAAQVNVNADALITACEAVYAKVDGNEYSLRPDDANGPLTVFDPDLADALGFEDPTSATARDVVKGLYFTDGDILSTAARLVEFSGYTQDEVAELLEGE